MWERMESLSEVIKQTWDEELPAHNLLDLSSKLKSMMSSLRQWSKEHFGSVTKELEQAKTELEQLLMQDPVGNQVAIKHIQYKMDELLYREEMMWLQRSRISWLREGDRNTNFFHRKAAWRAKKNKIRRLKAEDGRYIENKKEMEEMATTFFKNLYTRDETICPEPLLDMIQNKVNGNMNDALCKPFTDDEISDALFQIGPLKAPGPDGFPARFFQRNWEVCKDHQGVRL